MRVTWNPFIGAIDFVLGKQQVASEAGLVLTNVPCLASVYVGAAVRMDSGTAENAIATGLVASNVLGFAISKPTTTTCNVRVSGLLEPVLTGLDDTKEYFLSATVAGDITTTIPTTSGHVVYKMGIPFSATELVIDKGNRWVRA